MAEHMVDVNDEDFRELLRIMRNYDKETLAEVIYYACETNRETVKLINEINLYMAGIKKVR